MNGGHMYRVHTNAIYSTMNPSELYNSDAALTPRLVFFPLKTKKFFFIFFTFILTNS